MILKMEYNDGKRNHIMSLFNGAIATSENTLKVTIPESFQTTSSQLKDLELKYTTESTSQEVLTSNPATITTPSTCHQADLCRPWNYEDFLYRLHSFQYSSGQWFAKPHCISPLECSLYGWINCEVDKITCYSCFVVLHHSTVDDKNGNILKDLLLMGHEPNCSWRQLSEKGFDRSFIDIPHIQSARELSNIILLNTELILSHINSINKFDNGVSATYTFHIPKIMIDQDINQENALSNFKTITIDIKKSHNQQLNELIKIINEVRSVRNNAIKTTENTNINVYSNKSIAQFSYEINNNSSNKPTSFFFLMSFVKSHYTDNYHEIIDILKFALIIAECGWIASKVTPSILSSAITNTLNDNVDDSLVETEFLDKLLALHCTLCGRSVSLERYKHVSEAASVSESKQPLGLSLGLDLIAQHRPYCPWVNPTSSSMIPTWLCSYRSSSSIDNIALVQENSDSSTTGLPDPNPYNQIVPQAWYINLAAFVHYSDPAINNFFTINNNNNNNTTNVSDVTSNNNTMLSDVNPHSMHTYISNMSNNYNNNNNEYNANNNSNDFDGSGILSISPEQAYKRIRSILDSTSSSSSK